MSASTAAVDELREQGKALAKAKDYQGAVGCFEAIVKHAPQDVRARKSLVKLYAKLDDDDRVVQALQGIVGVHAAKGELFKAIAACKRILEVDPAHRATQRVLADLYARQTQRHNREEAQRADRHDVGADGKAPLTAPPDAMRDAMRHTAQQAAPVDDPKGQHEVHGIPVSLLKPCAFFSQLGQDAFVAFAEHMNVRHADDGDVLVQEGQVGASMFIVVEGAVQVRKRIEQHDVVMAQLGEGAFFGEMALLSDAPRSATVTATEPTTLLELNARLWHTLLQNFPAVGQTMQRFQVQRLVQNVMQASPFFLALHPVVRRSVMEQFRMQSVKQGQVLIERGTRASGFFIQLLGQSEVLGDDDNPVAWLSEADVFGEIALLEHGDTTATVRATTDGAVLRLAPADFQDAIAQHPDAKEALDALRDKRLLGIEDAPINSSSGFHV